MKGTNIICITRSSKATAQLPFDGADTDNLDHDAAILMPLMHSKTHLIRSLAKSCDISEAALIGPCQGFDIARKRWRAAYLLRKTGLSYPRIGRLLNRNWTSIIHGVKRFQACVDAKSAPIQIAAE